MLIRNLRSLYHRISGRSNRLPNSTRKWRPSWLPPSFPLYTESSIHPHCAEERADMFLAHNTGSTEIETLNWLHATVCLTKPARVLETGAFDGIGTLALASACRDNGFGTVHSVEINPAACTRLTRRLQKYGLTDFAEVHCRDSLAFLRETTLQFDFSFFDSLCEIRAEEYRICQERNLIAGIAAFHDTSVYRPLSFPDTPPAHIHAKFRSEVLELAKDPRNSGVFEHNLSRGLIVCFPKAAKPELSFPNQV